MAKRKRLTPPKLSDDEAGAPETKSIFPSYPMGVAPGPSPRRAPIADVAGAAAATAALSEVAAELEAVRAEGRLVQALPLETVVADHLVRDRLTAAVADDEMQSLMASLRARGQQTPIEVVETEPGRYGLISGWRRLSALRALHAETDEPRFATVHALVRRPETAADAYIAMVEENEIRVGLSYFERARIVARAVEEGVYPDIQQGLNCLFGSASRAKRSKIKSFLPLVKALGGHLNFPAAIGERLGLKLSVRLEEDGFATRLKDRLRKASPNSAEAEGALLQRALTEAVQGVSSDAAPVSGSPPVCAPALGEEIAPGLWFCRDGKGLHVSGPGLTKEVEARLRATLEAVRER